MRGLVGGIAALAAWGVICLGAGLASAKELRYRLYAETFEDGRMIARSVSDFELEPVGKADDMAFRLSLPTVRHLSAEPTLETKSRPGITVFVTLGPDARIPNLRDVEGLESHDSEISAVLADFLTVLSANSGPLTRKDPEKRQEWRVRDSQLTLDPIHIRDWAAGERLPVAVECAEVRDTLTYRGTALVVYHTEFQVPDEQCRPIIGYSRDAVDNLFRIERTGESWRHMAGTQNVDVETRVNPRTGIVHWAGLQRRQDLQVREHCTRHGALCRTLTPMLVERMVEVVLEK